MQAICLAVKAALSHPIHTPYIILWTKKTSCDIILTLSPHRHHRITWDIHMLISTHLESEYFTFDLHIPTPSWPRKPLKDDLWSMDQELDALSCIPLDPSLLMPKQEM